MHERSSSGQSLDKIDQGLLGLDLDNNRFHPVFGHVPRVRNHHDDGLTHTPDVSTGQDPPRPARVVLVVDEVIAHERSEVVSGAHGANPRNGCSFLRVDRNDPTTSHVTPHECSMKGPRYDDVVDELAMTGKEARILLAGHSLPDKAGTASHHRGHGGLPTPWAQMLTGPFGTLRRAMASSVRASAPAPHVSALLARAMHEHLYNI